MMPDLIRVCVGAAVTALGYTILLVGIRLPQ